MKLYWHPFSVFPRRVRIALREKDVACEEVVVDLPGGALHEDAFRRLNPFGQLPVLEDGDVVLAESVAILEYLEDRHPSPALLPPDAARRAKVRELVLWSGDYLAPAWKAVLRPLFVPDVGPDDALVVQGRRDLAAHLDVLEARLGHGFPWLGGEYSLADVCYAPFVTVLEAAGAADLLRARPRVDAWVARLDARPAVRATRP